MGVYSKWILPPLLHLAMGQKDLRAYRQRIVPAARGRVLEIGIGSGLNLPFYGSDVTVVIGVDPSLELLRMAETKGRSTAFAVDLVSRSAEELPFEDASVDTVVMTWTLCSIPNPQAALREMRRVLKPGGDLLFVEHGLSPDPGVAAWQHRLTPIWKRIGGGCHLDRDVSGLLQSAGWELPDLKTGYMRRGPRPMTFMYEGRARRDTPTRDAAGVAPREEPPHYG
jgi:ubiquinone/menaquinone biosynthesis C-methylase UbiE